MHTKNQTLNFVASTLLCGLALLAVCLPVAGSQWSGGGTNLNWSTAANWTDNAPPAGPTDRVFFLGGDYPISTNTQGAVNNIFDGSSAIGTLDYRAMAPGSNHTTFIPALEDEMCDFGLDGLSSGRSPDRLDALVWAVSALTFAARGEPRVRAL